MLPRQPSSRNNQVARVGTCETHRASGALFVQAPGSRAKATAAGRLAHLRSVARPKTRAKGLHTNDNQACSYPL